MDLYTKAVVRTWDGSTAEFRTSSGVLRNYTLSLPLFLLVVDNNFRGTLLEENSFLFAFCHCSRSPAVQPALAYVDVALSVWGIAAAQRAFSQLCDKAAQVGLQVNGRKTKMLNFGFNNALTLLMRTGETIASCEDFIYLDSRLMNPTAHKNSNLNNRTM